jgi:hypothetical protein
VDSRFYCRHYDGHLDWYATEAEARRAAEEAIEDARAEDDGWPGGTEAISYGVELGCAEVSASGVDEDDDLEWKDYAIERTDWLRGLDDEGLARLREAAGAEALRRALAVIRG